MLYFCTRNSALRRQAEAQHTILIINPLKTQYYIMKYKVVEGKNPKTEEPIFYAMAAPVTVVKESAIAREISQECTVTPHDILAVISSLEERIIAHVQQGQSVRLGMLGSFCPTVRSNSASTEKGFTIDNIRSIGVAFTPSATMRYQLAVNNPNVNFERVD